MDKNLPEISFSPEAEKKAIELAAFDILKQLCDQGKITKRELDHIAEKYDVVVEK